MNPFQPEEPSAYRMAVAQHGLAMAHAVKIMRNYGGSLSVEEMARGVGTIVDALMASAPKMPVVATAERAPVTDDDLHILDPVASVPTAAQAAEKRPRNGWQRVEPLDEGRPT